MRLSDLVSAAAGGLWRQKVRTLLTLAGVAVGACSLAFSLSLGVGLRDLIDREFQAKPGFWEIDVSPGGFPKRDESEIPDAELAAPDDFAPERKARLRRHLANIYWQTTRPFEARPLTPAALAELAAMPDVLEVRTARHAWGRITLGEASRYHSVAAGRLDAPAFVARLVGGRMPTAPNEIAVRELVLFDLGVKTEAAFAAALGRPVTVTIGEPPKDEKPLKVMPPPVVATFTLVGVVRAAEEKEKLTPDGWAYEHAGAYVTPAAGDALARNFPRAADGRVDNAHVRIRPGSDLPAAVKRVEAAGFVSQSAVQWYAGAKREVTMIAAGLNVFALVSLVVAALGITNTLVTSVVERTREIGVWKALGARDGEILGLFLLEGTLIGGLGGVLGLALARLAAGPADTLVRRLVQEQARDGPLVTESVFDFPPWLCLLTIGFAGVVTTLAAIYPARRAARVRPVEALRHD